MIKTHVPRGSLWRCPSLFQQTPTIRDIDFEECLAISAADSLLDEFAGLPLAKRVAKCRRIEKLAGDFLNGVTLQIVSARPPPESQSHHVCAVFENSKLGRLISDEAKVSLDAGLMWEDVEDDIEYLRGFTKEVSAPGKMMTAANAGNVDVIEVHAQASCRSERRRQRVHTQARPSEAALKAAAELRDRRLQRLAAANPVIADSRPPSPMRVQTDEPGDVSSFATTVESTWDSGPIPTAAWTSNMWLQSGKVETRQKAVDEECSRDELGASSFATPSRQSRQHSTLQTRLLKALPSQHSFSESRSTASTTNQVASFDSRLSDHPYYAVQGSGLVSSTAMHDETHVTQASEEVEGLATDMLNTQASNVDQIELDSQTELLIRKGICADPQKSWTPANARHAVVEQTAPTDGAEKDLQRALNSSTIRASIQESAARNAGKPTKSKRPKSIGSALTEQSRRRSTRRKSAPSESQAAVEERADLPLDQQSRLGTFRVQCSVPMGDNASPFIFRKRVSKFNDSEDPDLEPIQAAQPVRSSRRRTPRLVKFLSSDENPDSTHNHAETTPRVPPSVASATDVRQDSTLSVMSDTPLMTKHLNHVLPRNSGFDKRSSSVKKALREEMRLSGAEITRVDGLLDSSQREPDEQHPITHHTRLDDHDVENQPTEHAEVAPQTQWAGTQNLMAEAHRDLVASPDKTGTSLYLGDKSTPRAGLINASRVRPGTGYVREPLQVLSQGPVVSTQALLDDWSGFESVKKKASIGQQDSLAESPSLVRYATASDPIGAADYKRSSLRHSISYDDSPAPTSRISATQQTPGASILRSRLSGSQPDRRSSSKRASQVDTTTFSFSISNSIRLADAYHGSLSTYEDNRSVHPLPSYQNAQVMNMGDSQELNRTITELAGDVLGDGRQLQSVRLSRAAGQILVHEEFAHACRKKRVGR